MSEVYLPFSPFSLFCFSYSFQGDRKREKGREREKNTEFQIGNSSEYIPRGAPKTSPEQPKAFG